MREREVCVYIKSIFKLASTCVRAIMMHLNEEVPSSRVLLCCKYTLIFLGSTYLCVLTCNTLCSSNIWMYDCTYILISLTGCKVSYAYLQRMRHAFHAAIRECNLDEKENEGNGCKQKKIMGEDNVGLGRYLGEV